ncbi:HepT-like ribonuclease domain-containing protein [Spirosoma pomorum]
MFSNRNLTYICTLLECIEKIFLYSDGFNDATEFALANDQLNFNATWGLLLVVGEESKKIDKELKHIYSDIAWQQMAGMRNYLAHDYRGVDKELVYQTSRYSLTKLKEALIHMIDSVDYEDGALAEALDSPYYQHIQYLRTKLK